MKNRIFGIFLVLCIAISGVLSISSFLKDNKTIDVILNDLDAIAQNESGSDDQRKGYVDNPQSCVIKEVYECRVGITIPDWVPYVGGMQCYTTYIDEVEFPGTQNSCIYTGNMNQTCDYYRCTKN